MPKEQLTLVFPLVYCVKSPTSKGVSSESARDADRSCLGRLPTPPVCLRRPRWPGTYGGEEALVTEPRGEDLGLDLASFHAATMLRTKVIGEQGDVWGRRRGDPSE